MCAQKNSSALRSRLVALELLEKLLKKTLFFDELLEQSESYKKLDLPAQKFAYKLCLDFFRLYEPARHYFAKKIKRFHKMPYRLQLILILALVEHFYFKTPPYAIVNNALELLKYCKFFAFKALGNAVLRAALKELDTPLRAEFPLWIKKRLAPFYSAEEIEAMAEASFRQPPLDMYFISSESAKEDFGKKDSILLTPFMRRFSSFFPFEQSEAFKKGNFWIQDYAATLPIAELEEDLKGKKVLDICAAPGGKTMQLICLGAEVTALDKSAKRLARLKENLKRCHMQAKQIICADFLDYSLTHPVDHNRDEGLYDLVLLDAPCSATGTIRKHGELALIKDGSGMEDLLQIQKKLLARAALFVKKGGLLIYCTCSLFPEEGELQIQQFLKENKHWQSQKERRLLPQEMEEKGGLDGFYFNHLCEKR